MSYYGGEHNINHLLGKTLVAVNNVDDRELVFEMSDGETYKLYHEQGCCESVYLAEVIGNLQDLVGSPLTEAEEVSSEGHPAPSPPPDDSYSWTFYKLGTRKGGVTLRWLGSSNGYYSEDVSFMRCAA